VPSLVTNDGVEDDSDGEPDVLSHQFREQRARASAAAAARPLVSGVTPGLGLIRCVSSFSSQKKIQMLKTTC